MLRSSQCRKLSIWRVVFAMLVAAWVCGTDQCLGQTKEQLNRIYNACVKGGDREGAANIKLKLGDLDGAARNLRFAIRDAKRKKDQGMVLRLLERLEKVENDIRKKAARASRVAPTKKPEAKDVGSSEWLWNSGGILTLQIDGVAKHSRWKRNGKWSKKPNGEIHLEGGGGIFRVIETSETSAGVFKEGGGHTVIQRQTSQKLEYGKFYRVRNYNGRGLNAVVQFSEDGVGRYWGINLGEDGVACKWWKKENGSIEIRRGDRGANTGWVFALDEDGLVKYIYERYYKRHLPVEVIPSVHIGGGEEDELLKVVLCGVAWHLQLDPPQGTKIIFEDDGTVGIGRTESEYKWLLRNGRVLLLTKNGAATRAFKYNASTGDWSVDPSVVGTKKISPEMRMVAVEE